MQPSIKDSKAEITIENWKCSLHKESFTYFLHFSIKTKAHKICQWCKFQNNIPECELLSIPELLQLDENELFSSYPMLGNDQNLLELKGIQSDYEQILSEIKKLFTPNSSNDTNFSILYQQKFSGQVIKSLDGILSESKEVYLQQIGMINKIKLAFLLEASNSESTLHNIILSYFEITKSNTQKIKEAFNRFQKIHQAQYEKVSQSQIETSSFAISTQQAIKQTGLKSSYFNQNKYELFRLKKYANLSFLKLDLEKYILESDEASSFFSSLIQIKNLNRLQLRLPNLKIDEIKQLSLALIQLKHLKLLQLDLYDSQNGIQGVTFISSALQKLMCLESLQLELINNKIDINGARHLFSTLDQLQNLRSLHLQLSNNSFYELNFPSSLENLKNLESLFMQLWNCQIDSQQFSLFSTTLSQLSKLTSLKLEFFCNNIGSNTITKLWTVEQKNLTYLKLDLDWCTIGELGVQMISYNLNYLSNLTSLILLLKNNNINNKEAANLVKSFSNLKKLTFLELQLQDNPISFSGVYQLFSHLNQLVGLKYLKLQLNCFNDFIQDDNSLLSLNGLQNLTSLLLEFEFENQFLIKRDNYPSWQNQSSQIYSFRGNLYTNCSHLNNGNNDTNKRHFLLISSLTSELIQLKLLKHLSLKYNFLTQSYCITKQSVELISKALKQLQQLESLELEIKKEKLKQDDLNILISAITELNNLTCLKMNVLGFDISWQSDEQRIEVLKNLKKFELIC